MKKDVKGEDRRDESVIVSFQKGTGSEFGARKASTKRSQGIQHRAVGRGKNILEGYQKSGEPQRRMGWLMAAA